MKTLNLDDLGKALRSVTLFGKEHEVKEMSVEDFIAGVRSAQALEKKGGADVADNLQASVEHLARFLPTIPKDDLAKLNLRQIKVLVDFVNGALEDEAAKGEVKTGEDASPN